MSEIAENTTLSQLTLFAEDSLANLTVLPGSDEARRMTVTSGRNIAALLPNSGPVGLLVKMCLESEALSSTRCYLTWNVWTTKQGRLLFRLAPWMPHTDGIEYGLWPTMVIPNGGRTIPPGSEIKGNMTPTAYRDGKKYQLDLNQAVKRGLWPTPQAHDATGPRGKGNTFSDNHYYPHDLSTAVMWPTMGSVSGGGPHGLAGGSGNMNKLRSIVGLEVGKQMGSGSLNPTWAEWLMGFPLGWTDLKHSETP